MASGAWISMSMTYHIISIIIWFAVEGTSGGSDYCLVTPSAVAVVAGDPVSLTCTTSRNTFIGWRRGGDYNSGSTVYQAPVYGENNSLQVPRMLVDGYVVNSPLILTMNNASTVQADRYYCSCYTTPAYAAANVSVLVSNPTFSTISLIDGGPVNMTCSVSFNGTADASLQIVDSSGIIIVEKSEVGYYPSPNKLRFIIVDNSTTANPSVIRTYSCQLILSDNSIRFYSVQATSMHWVSVRNVQINPVEKTNCLKNGKCAINQSLNCSAEAAPYPTVFQWTYSLNGSQFSYNASGLLTLTYIGNYTVLCNTSNMIEGIQYQSASEYFNTEVTVDGPPERAQSTGSNSNTPLIAGLVVGLGGALIIILVIVTVLICKRKKSRTVCCNPDDNESRNNRSVELTKQQNGNNSFNTDKKNVHDTSGVQNKGYVKNPDGDVTVVENDLYSADKPKPQIDPKSQIDPSDGGYASVNEVRQQHEK